MDGGARSGRRRVAVVTGASSGIGQATAVLLARRGYDVAITHHRNAAGARRTVQAIEGLGRRAASARMDLADPAGAPGVLGALADQLGPADVLVNNAGVNRRAAALDETLEGWEATLAVDLLGPFACARFVARGLIDARRTGSIVNVTSVLATAAIRGGAAYCAAKAALWAMTRVMALEWASAGIRVNAVAPGHTVTPMNVAPERVADADLRRPVIPLGRAATAGEVAAAVAYLAGDESAYCTGSEIVVDGGLLLRSGPEALARALGAEVPVEMGP
jgi:NAD(P)-dependent dehydrogenase (short-subunit alcohol dehydrogenase family)